MRGIATQHGTYRHEPAAPEAAARRRAETRGVWRPSFPID